MFDLDRLQTTLLKSGLQQKDQPLYQVINQLLQAVREFQDLILAQADESTNILSTGLFLTHAPDLAALPASRVLLAGTDVSFDDSVFGERTVNVTGSGSSAWSVLTDGDLIEPELIFAGGDVIMLEFP